MDPKIPVSCPRGSGEGQSSIRSVERMDAALLCGARRSPASHWAHHNQ